jgi:hypothetical protein
MRNKATTKVSNGKWREQGERFSTKYLEEGKNTRWMILLCLALGVTVRVV